jgi:hypothetical protein
VRLRIINGGIQQQRSLTYRAPIIADGVGPGRWDFERKEVALVLAVAARARIEQVAPRVGEPEIPGSSFRLADCLAHTRLGPEILDISGFADNQRLAVAALTPLGHQEPLPDLGMPVDLSLKLEGPGPISIRKRIRLVLGEHASHQDGGPLGESLGWILRPEDPNHERAGSFRS